MFTRDYLTSNQFTVIPKSSTLLFSKTDFESKLKKNFPIINIAYVTFPKPDAIDIHIQEKKSMAVWCFLLPVVDLSIKTVSYMDKHPIFPRCLPGFHQNQLKHLKIFMENRL
ncbi:MAG: FtsQ-type POTRA domain-containing protein [Crocinitomicaceae bacterium]|nr:FtsQ-type POTRA domain-containing protein [Crocinitomicaceae bacterium]